MRNRAPTTLQEVLQQMRHHSPHKHKLTEGALACAWKATMPEAVQKKTERTFYKEGKFFIQVSSAPLRQELRLNQDKVLALLREHALEDSLEEVVFL